MIQFEIENQVGVWTDRFTAEASIENGKMSLKYFYTALQYPFGSKPITSIQSYEDAPCAIDTLIDQARAYCNRNNLILWSY